MLEESPPSPVWRRRRPAPVLVVALAFAALQAGLLLHTAADKADTADEWHYVTAGGLQWAHGNFRFNCEAPALPKWGFALGIRLVDETLAELPKNYRKVTQALLFGRPYEEMRRNLFAARVASILVVVLGGLLLWLAARRFGEWNALFTHALWCFSPTVLGNGALATHDGWAAAAGCGVILTTLRLYERPTLMRSAWVGLFLGLGAASKMTTLGVVPVVAVIGVLAYLRVQPRSYRSLAASAAVCTLSALFTLWMIYDFSVGTVHFSRMCGGNLNYAKGSLANVPAWEWFEGVLFQMRHGERGHRSYLFGEMGFEGWWWFYFACVAFKISVGAQSLAVLRVAALVKLRGPRSRLLVDALILAFPLVLFIVLSRSKTQNGIKYLLPAFPYVMLWTGQVVRDATRAFGGTGLLLSLGLLAGGVTSTLAVHPHHLMFFNAWAGGPEGGPRYLLSGDDWGQDTRRLREWLRENGVKEYFYQRYGPAPHAWGIRGKKPPCEPTPGVYAAHAIEVHRPGWLTPGCLDWLTVEPPDERLGYTVYIWRVDEARIARLKDKRGKVKPFVKTEGQEHLAPWHRKKAANSVPKQKGEQQ